MEIEVRKIFEKDYKKLGKSTQEKINKFLVTIRDSKSISEIDGIKKLSGCKNYYRYKIGNYRLGFQYNNQKVIIERLLPRKDIYKKYP